MRKLILLFLVCWLPSYGALNHTIILDVRTPGSDSNAGGFDPSVTSPGTDESQQNAGTAYVDVLVGATTTQATSVLQPFTATTHGPGNLLRVTSGTGCTTGTFEMLSQSGGTATFDRSLGTAASVCTGVLGGSKATVAAALTLVAVAGYPDTIYVKTGTYTQTATLSAGMSGASLNYSVIGYNLTHGDLSGIPCTTVATCPIITQTTASTDLFDVGTSSGNGVAAFHSLYLSNTSSGTHWHGIAAYPRNGYLTVTDCVLTGFDVALKGDNTGGNQVFDSLILEDSEITASTTSAINSGDHAFLKGNYVHNNAGQGFWDANRGNYQMITLIGNVFYANHVGVQLEANTPSVFQGIENVFDSNTVDGLLINSQLVTVGLMDNIFWGNGGYGIDTPGASGPTPYYPWGSDFFPSYNGYNWYGSNSLGAKNGWPAGNGDGALSANPFVSDSGGNFALNATAGGGAPLKAAGFPGVSPMGTGYLDIGALQSQAAAGASIAAGSYVQ
jgi:hypothetical protein